MKMELSTRIMSDIIAHMKYARFMPEKNRRETYLETVGRTEDMMLRKFPEHEGLIREAYDLVREKKILPSMRALEDSTPIITKSGWKPVGELQVGDIVYSSSGGETKVTEVIKHENKDLYKITFSDYAEIVACDDHLWIVSTNDDLRSNKTRVVDTKFVRAHLTQSGKNNITIWNPAPLQFSKKEYIIDPYILGHWLGDGFSNGHQTTLPVEDAEFFVAEYKKFGYGMTQSKSSNFWVWSVCGLYPQLKELNLVRNKHIPEEYLYGSVEQRLDLLQGLIDTNGHIAPEGRCFFYNTNTKIIGGVKQILSSLGIKYTVILHKKREKHHLDTYTVSFFTNLPVARLPRKKKNIRDFASKRAGSRKVFSVEHVGRGNATCINVTSPDRSFLAGEQMIVTHNCLQFAGRAIEVNNLRLYNCSYLPIDSPRAFSEFAFLLLCGTGVGMSVQKHHIKQLPPLVGAKAPEGRQHKKRFLISDDIEGWADAIKVLMESYFFGERQIAFDYRAIREKGALLKTSGGRAPGPAPLEACLVKIEHILAEAVHSRGSGTQLLPIEVYDICCHIGDMVLSGGVRRSASIVLFSVDDDAMMESKFGNWYETNPQRGRSNNSVMLLRDRITREKFDEVWSKVQASGAGEPGIVFSSDRDLGVNPCCEISLQSNELCNLTEINVSDLESQEDFEYRARMASRIATLQASFTDFHYVREQWRENVEEEALIGVSMTGIASGKVLELDMEAAAKVVVEENAKMAKLLNINPSARSTCVKPSGTASLVLGTSSGIHAWYAPYYWRRVSVGKEEPIYTYLKNNHPELLEDDFFKPTTMAKIKIPMKAPEGAMLRYESALDTLERVKKVQAEWITPGHTSGANKNNVSCTISVRENEWEEVGDWMWENRDNFTGISVLPYDGGSYVQTPFEECTKEEYEEALKYLTDIDLTAVYESEDNTILQGEAACSGGACEVL